MIRRVKIFVLDGWALEWISPIGQGCQV